MTLVLEDRKHGPTRRGDELAEWVANRQQRLQRTREAKAALEAVAKATSVSKAEEISADAGYCCEENLKGLNRRQVNG